MDLSVNRLEQLVTVARLGSFSRAAAALNISQPALSRSVAALEKRYGFQIFNRVGHGVEPTPAGAQVLAQAERLLQDMRVFDGNLRLIASGEAGQLSIGLAPLLASQTLARFTGDFFGPDSKARLRVMIRAPDELLAALRSDEVELLFFPESYLEPSSDIAIAPIGCIEPAFVVRSGHPLATKAHVTMADLQGYPWASSVAPVALLDAMGDARLTCDNFHIMREALSYTDLICICSTDFVAPQIADGTLRILTMRNSPLDTIQVYMATLRGRVHSPLAAQAAERMRTLLAP